MKNILTTLLLATTVFAIPAFAQDPAKDPTANADPACVVNNVDGTKTLDMVKCKDGKPIVDMSNTGTTPATGSPLIVSPELLANSTIISASDFVGKRVYSSDGTEIGEVNDFFVTNDGKVQGVVLGVGGFLGIGEKDVVVSMPSIQMQTADGSTKLVIPATKDELNAAPAYDRTKRVYVQ